MPASAPDPPPFSLLEASWYAGKGVGVGLWRLTFGTAKGLFWDLPKAAIGGVAKISTGTLNMLDRTVELWTATENDPAARQQLLNLVANKSVNFKSGLQVGKLIALGWVLGDVTSSDLSLSYEFDD